MEPTNETAWHVRVGDQPFADFLAALHHADDAGRQARLGEQLDQAGAGQRRLLGGLEDERVAAGDGDRHHPQRDHRREIERRNADDDAERFAHDVAIDIARDVRQRLAHQQRGNAAGELDDVDAAAQRSPRPRSAACRSRGRCQSASSIEVRLQQFADSGTATRARSGDGVARQPGKAAAAAAQASSTCSGDASRTSATTSRGVGGIADLTRHLAGAGHALAGDKVGPKQLAIGSRCCLSKSCGISLSLDCT